MLFSPRSFGSVLLIVSFFAVFQVAGDTLSTASGGNWSNAAQWTPAVIPDNTASQSFDVTVPASVSVALDYNPTINTFTLNGELISGATPSSQGPLYTTLTINGNVYQNGSIDNGIYGFSRPYGLVDNVVVGGNFKNTGSSVFEGGLSIAGNLNNSGSMQWLTYPYGPPYVTDTLTVGGRVSNTGVLNFNNTTSQLGSSSTTILNSGTFNIGSLGSNPTVTVAGNFSNSGNLAVSGISPSYPPLYGPSTLVVNGTLTNQANGTLTVNNGPSRYPGSAPGILIAQNLINYGTATFDSPASSSVQQLTNNGTFNLLSGTVNVSTLDTAGGDIIVEGGTLSVGSGTASPAFGYQQFADGTLDYAGGNVDLTAPAILNGTLDIVLGQGYQPVGTTYVVLADYQSTISGTFSNVEGLVFDGGRERYLLSYDTVGGPAVTLTVEDNVTPEPASVCLVLLGAGSMLCAARARSRRRL